MVLRKLLRSNERNYHFTKLERHQSQQRHHTEGYCKGSSVDASGPVQTDVCRPLFHAMKYYRREKLVQSPEQYGQGRVGDLPDCNIHTNGFWSIDSLKNPSIRERTNDPKCSEQDKGASVPY